MRKRMYNYLTGYCNFQKRTLDLLDYPNLEKLAADYGFKK